MKTINAMQRFLPVLCLILGCSLISACSHYRFPWVYRLDIEQGNIVDEDKLEQLKVGMTQSQVRYLLGTPITQDTFNQSRWDYYYSFKTGEGHFDRHRLTLTFQGKTLATIEETEYESEKLNN